MTDLNWIDKTVAWFNPQAGLQRARSRAAFDAVRSFDGASSGRRTKNWRTPSTSANAENEAAHVTLRNRSRDLVRNNPYANKAVQTIVSNTVGYGVMAGFTGPNARLNKAANKVWAEWAHSSKCDANGIHDFYGIQALVLRTVVESGECLILRETSPALKTPLRLRVLEPDHLDSSRDGKTADGNTIRNGIEYDISGEPLAYWLYDHHPGDRWQFEVSTYTSKRIPAERVAHIFRVDRPGQRRGIPWSAPVMLRLRDLDDYEDAQLTRQKIAACFTAFVTDSDPDSTAQVEMLEKMEPGIIELMPPGRDVKIATPPTVTGYNEYVQQVLHAVACGFGISYESLTGDLANTNFSSGRMGWIEMHRNIEAWRWQMLIPQMMGKVWDWFEQAAGIAGTDLSRVLVEWTPPRREMIDPTKEVPAVISAIRGGLMTLSEAQRSFGFDPERMLEEYKGDFDKLDSLGLTLDCDPRKTDHSGKRSDIEPETDEELDDAIRSLTRAFGST